MTNHHITQSQKRFQDSIGSLFRPWDSSPKDIIFLKSSSDIGVQRNGGRNGARYAPQSLLSYFKKLNKTKKLENFSFCEVEVSCELEESGNFEIAQQKQSQRISSIIEASPGSFLCHIGGGHDHVYPLLMALSKRFSRIIVINIDAHADTRTDTEFHSGTPFRQFDLNGSAEFYLFQIGLHPFANSLSTISPLTNGKMSILWRDQLRQEEAMRAFFDSIKPHITNDTAIIFSLDADALDGSQVSGVSAVNGKGLTLLELENLWSAYQKLGQHHSPILGIYELNPVYDSVSMLSMRTIGNFLFGSLEN